MSKLEKDSVFQALQQNLLLNTDASNTPATESRAV